MQAIGQLAGYLFLNFAMIYIRALVSGALVTSLVVAFKKDGSVAGRKHFLWPT